VHELEDALRAAIVEDRRTLEKADTDFFRRNHSRRVELARLIGASTPKLSHLINSFAWSSTPLRMALVQSPIES